MPKTPRTKELQQSAEVSHVHISAEVCCLVARGGAYAMPPSKVSADEARSALINATTVCPTGHFTRAETIVPPGVIVAIRAIVDQVERRDTTATNRMNDLHDVDLLTDNVDNAEDVRAPAPRCGISHA